MMKILEIVQLLEKTMNSRMEEFVKLGRATKQLTNKRHSKKQVARLKIAMAQIVKELEPVKAMVLEENPCYTNLFEALTLLYDQHFQENSVQTKIDFRKIL